MKTLLQTLGLIGWLVAIALLVQNHKFHGAILDELYTVEAQCHVGPGDK